MPWAGNITVNVRAQTTDGPTGKTTTRSIDEPASGVSFVIANGTGAAQSNHFWASNLALTSTNTVLNLTSLANDATRNTGTANFTAIDGVLIYNLDVTNTITAFAAATNSFQAGLSAGASEVIPPSAGGVPGLIHKQNATAAGWTTTSAFNLRLQSNANANCVVVIWGTGTP